VYHYGAHDHSLRQLRAGSLRLVSGGRAERTFLAGPDLGRALYAAAVRGRPGATYLAGGFDGTWRDLLTMAAAVMGIPARISSIPYDLAYIDAAVRWLRANAKKYHLDPNHFGAWGASAGGHLVALLGTTGEVKDFDKGPNLQFSSRVQAVCDFFGPTVLSGLKPDTKMLTEEPFAPVMPVLDFGKIDDVIRAANNTRYGLAAYVFTNDLTVAWRMAEGLEAGIIGVNDPVPATPQCPFGGMKESGLGRELGHEGLEAYLETKYVSFKLRDG